MTNTKSIGDNESHYLSPRPWQILRPGEPLRRAFVLAVERIVEIQLVQFLGQPIADRRSKRKTHPTESKAFAISIFNLTRGFLLAAKTFVVPRTHRKLS
jgi:hypothetical protein